MNSKHLYGQMWINVHLFFKLLIKPDLLPTFLPLDYRLIEIKTDRERKPKGEKEQRKDRTGYVCSEPARRNQTVKWKQAKKKERKKRIVCKWDCQMLLIPVAGW